MPEFKEIIENIQGNSLSKEEKALLKKAYLFAEKAHENQFRKSGEPYFAHAFETAKILAKLGMDSKSIAAGLLHDVLEDTQVGEEELKNEFGGDILYLIKGVTKLGTLKYRGYERHIESLRKFFIAISNDLRIVIIKLADRLHNLKTLQYVEELKRERIAMESIQIYAPLADRLGMGKLKSEIEEYAFIYAYPKEYEEVNSMLNVKKEEHKKNLDIIKKNLEKELIKNHINISEINYRVKTKYSLWRKLQRYNMDIEKIYDIIALRVVVQNIEDCYKVLGLAHSLWKPMLGRIKDYISVPKPNGYRSLHTTVFTGETGIIEIQIRTEEMHAEAAYGIAAHFAYKDNDKEKIKTNKNKFYWIEQLKELNYNPANPKTFLENLKTDFFSHRIFILTPKGDVIDLPESSTPIDFAYAVHSDIGEHIAGAKINGKLSQIFSKLKNGDIIEIITKKDAHPSRKWLDNVKTNIAKKNIKSYLEKNDKSLLDRLKNLRK